MQQFYSGMSAYEIRDHFAAEFPNRAIPAASTIYKIVEKFKETGSVEPSALTDYSQSSRRISEEKQFEICAFREDEVAVNSCRSIASDVGVSATTVRKILNQQRYGPYKRSKDSYQRISTSDEERRMIFCEAFMEECNSCPDLIDTICTSGECSFSLKEALLGGQSVWDWSGEYDRQVTVWVGMVGDRMIGPFFVDGSKIKAEKYLVLLREKIVPAIRYLEQEVGVSNLFVYCLI